MPASLLAFALLTAMACSSGSRYQPAGGAQEVRQEPADQQEPGDQPVEDQQGGSPVHFAGQRLTVGMEPATSIECYTFYPDDSVELRHNGQLTDTGTYSGDTTGGQVRWDSGRRSSVAVSGQTLTINGLKLVQIRSCLS